MCMTESGFNGRRSATAFNSRTVWFLMMGLLLAFMATAATAAVEPLDRVIAVVDDDIVMASELRSRIAQVVARIRQQNMPVPPEDMLRKRVLEQLIMESIQLQKADQAGIRASDNQLTETMTRIAQGNNMTLDEFQAALEQEGVSYAQAREQIRREMIISRYQQRRVEARVNIADSEVETYLRSAEGQSRTSEEYRLGHILVSVPDQPSQEQLAQAREKVQAIYQQIRAGADFQQLAITQSDAQTALEGGDLGWRPANQLPTLFAEVVPKLAVGEVSEPLQAGSGFHLVKLLDKRGGVSQLVEQTHVRHILIRPTEIRSEQEAQNLAQRIHERLAQGGEDFAELARAYSDDPASASNGGDMEWVSPGDTVPEFDRAMQNTPIGSISQPIRTQFGWHILQVLDRRQQDMGERMQDAQARQILFRRKFEEELQNWLREIREEAYVEIKEPGLS